MRIQNRCLGVKNNISFKFFCVQESGNGNCLVDAHCILRYTKVPSVHFVLVHFKVE